MAQPLPRDTIRPLGNRFRYGTALLVSIFPVALVTYYCIRHLDITVSLLVGRYLSANKGWSRYTSSIPDALFIVVIVITVGAYLRFRYKISRGEIDVDTFTYKTLAIAAPLSYTAKSILKYVFGRTNTREWLLAPQDYGFHWFQGGDRYSGFPSGHMAVFTALFAVLWRLHPRWRALYLAALLVLAVALIATNYHFLSDVIAGAYLGLAVEALAWHVAGRDKRFKAVPG